MLNKKRMFAAVALGTAFAMPATSMAGAATNDVYPHIWSADSPAYKSMPADAPIDPNSASIIANIKKWGIQYYGDKERQLPSMTLNNEQYSNPLWVAHNTDPKYDIQFWDCQGKGYVPQDFVQSLKGVHIPDAATPSPGTDSQLSIVNPDSGRYVDLWVAKKEGNVWKACWGGSIADASKSDTTFPFPLGTSASGLALEPYTVKVAELKAGHIDHPIGMALPPEVVDNYVSKPANRTDGSFNPTSNSISEGQYLKLPKDLNIDAMNLSPVAKIMAKAAQEHGFIIVDRAYAVTWSFENKSTFAKDPYPELFQGLAYWQVMWGDQSKGQQPFPFDKLQVVKRDYLPHGAPTGGGGTTPTKPTPTPTKPAPTTPAPTPTKPAPTTPAPTNGNVVIRQTAGWEDIKGPDGAVWKSRGNNFDTWTSASAMKGMDVQNTTNDVLYGTTLWTQSKYSAPVSNGTYKVQLFMAEDYWNAAGKRVFDVTAEGKTALSNVDIFKAAGGKFRGYEPEFTTVVTDGKLDLGWVKKTDAPMLAALKVTKVSDSTSTTPTTPTNPTPSIQVSVTDRSTKSFGFKATGAPAGSKMKITWTYGGKPQETYNTNLNFWSGDKPGWSNAKAVVLDSSNKVIAESAVINP